MAKRSAKRQSSCWLAYQVVGFAFRIHVSCLATLRRHLQGPKYMLLNWRQLSQKMVDLSHYEPPQQIPTTDVITNQTS